MHLEAGYTVRAFHPHTLGVVKEGRVLSVGPKIVRIDFGLTGSTAVRRRDVVEVTDTRKAV